MLSRTLSRFHPSALRSAYIKNPYKTKIFSAFLLGSLGDYLCQRIEFRFITKKKEAKSDSKFKWDKHRTYR